MKSIKEKAKAYDEAIKRAQAKMEEAKVFDYDDEQTAHTIRLTTTDIFPELKESEDEKIRKALKEYFINSFQNNGVAAICGVHIKDILAWLEKQKGTEREIEGNSLCNDEQKPYGQREECLDCQMNYAGECKGSCGMKRGEQKPQRMISAEAKEALYNKPAWSEEDEKFVHGLIRGLTAKRDIHGHTTFSSDCIDITETIDWLKSFKDRVQSKQEWSEEDDALLYGVIETEQYMLDVVTGEKTFDVGNEQIESQCTKELAWLKILKDRYTWKPSEEQMDALEDAIADVVSSIQKNVLNSLYSDLQKLR